MSSAGVLRNMSTLATSVNLILLGVPKIAAATARQMSVSKPL